MGKNKSKNYSDFQKQEIKNRDGNKCFFCETTKNLTIAHIFVPKREGAEPIPENGMCICRKCHDKLDFGIDCSIEEQLKMLRLCHMYLTFYYMREITDDEIKLKRKV